MRKDFLWGGAVAAHQVEGGYNEKGKGLNVSDMMTVGGVGKKRQITDTILPNEFYPNHEAIDFIIIIKKISLYSRKWVLRFIVCRSAGQESSLTLKMKHPMKRELNFMLMF